MSSGASDKEFLFGFSIVLVLLVILTIVIVIISRVVVPQESMMQATFSDDELVAQRLSPLGGGTLSDANDQDSTAVASAPPVAAGWLDGSLDGKSLYDSACTVCHSGKLPNTPQIGVSTDWVPRLTKGKDVLYTNAISGFNAMPARGASTMSDEQLKVVVDYILVQSK